MSLLGIRDLRPPSIPGNSYTVLSDLDSEKKTVTSKKPTTRSLQGTDKKMASLTPGSGTLVINNAQGQYSYELTSAHMKTIESLKNEFIKSGKTFSYISADTSGLPRRLLLLKSAEKIQAFLLSHKKILGDLIYGEGRNKTVNIGHEISALSGKKLPLVASISMPKDYDGYREISNLHKFRSTDGFVKYIYALEVPNKNKYRLIQPFYEKGSLDSYQPRSYKEVLGILCRVASTIAKLKKRKYVHRDLNPQQILLTESPAEEAEKLGGDIRADIGDLSSICKLDDDKNLKKFATTPMYCAPEAAKFMYAYLETNNVKYKSLIKIVSPAMDVWGIGCIMFKLFSAKKWGSYTSLKLSRLVEKWDGYSEKEKDNVLGIKARDDMPGIEALRPLLRAALHPDPKKRISIGKLRKSLQTMLRKLGTSKEEKNNFT